MGEPSYRPNQIAGVAKALAYVNPVLMSAAWADDQWYSDEAVDVVRRLGARPTSDEVRVAVLAAIESSFPGAFEAESRSDPALNVRLGKAVENIRDLLTDGDSG